MRERGRGAPEAASVAAGSAEVKTRLGVLGVVRGAVGGAVGRVGTPVGGVGEGGGASSSSSTRILQPRFK